MAPGLEVDMTELVCGSCGSSVFEALMGKRVCQHCHAEVDNEVAVAIEHGLVPTEEDSDGSA
jgi:uncharacterized Zn finger protein (UPF0148 family)